MGYLGLDWGNVPSWFSAASFSAAAYVIIRDRAHKKRSQIDSVGLWGEIEFEKSAPSDTPSTRIIPTLHVKNASKLPVYLVAGEYELSGQLRRKGSASEYGPTNPVMEPFPLSVDGRLGHSVIPPGEMVRIEGVSKVIEGHYDSIKVNSDGDRVANLEVIIKRISVRDNSGTTWKLIPRTGSDQEYWFLERQKERYRSIRKFVLKRRFM
ncbi:hypothetical protein [Amycolatopsis sp. NPDC004169]|uniref:hypothetical protein n=1 Tax=Amycolatopsis sp. NPDC004169 TaxID=3154453 RepID=UPI0033BE95C2